MKDRWLVVVFLWMREGTRRSPRDGEGASSHRNKGLDTIRKGGKRVRGEVVSSDRGGMSSKLMARSWQHRVLYNPLLLERKPH